MMSFRLARLPGCDRWKIGVAFDRLFAHVFAAVEQETAKVTAINAPRMAPSVPFRALLSVITTSNNPELSGQRLRRIEVPTLDGAPAPRRSTESAAQVFARAAVAAHYARLVC